MVTHSNNADSLTNSEKVYRTLEQHPWVPVLVGAFVLAAIYYAWQVPRENTPEAALQQVCAISSASDISLHRAYLTKQGETILNIMVPAMTELGFHPEFGAAVVNGDVSTVVFSDARTEGQLIFKHNGVWQLDNILMTKVNGSPLQADLSLVAEPMHALLKAFAEKSREQVMADNVYMTETGKKVLLSLIAEKENSARQTTPFGIENPIVGANIVQFPIASLDGRNEVCYNVVNDGGWKFDDMLVIKTNNVSINLMASYAIDHPFLAGFRAWISQPLF